MARYDMNSNNTHEIPAQQDPLLLSKFRVVVEELENTYLQYEEEKRQNEESKIIIASLKDRQESMFWENPGLFSVSEVIMKPDDMAGKNIEWELRGYCGLSRDGVNIKFETYLSEDRLDWVFHRPDLESSAPMLRLPLVLREDGAITLQTPLCEGAQYHAELWNELTCSDWDLMRAIPNALISFLDRSKVINTQLNINLRKAFFIHSTWMLTQQDVIRFDRGYYFQTSITSDQASIGVALEKCSFQNRRLAKIKFLFVCQITSGELTGLVYFIWRQGDGLEAWAPNTSDSDAPLMLVALGDEGWDGKIWEHLSANDRTLLTSLHAPLTLSMNLIKSKGGSVAPGMEQWDKLLSDVKSWSLK